MFKFFTYQINRDKFSTRIFLIEKSKLDYFKKIIYEGFEIIYSSSDFIHFKIDTQTIRKLKLKKIAEEIRFNSDEHKLTQLLDISKETPFLFEYSLYSSYSSEDIKLTKTLNQKLERNKILKNQSNKYNQKFKQYK